MCLISALGRRRTATSTTSSTTALAEAALAATTETDTDTDQFLQFQKAYIVQSSLYCGKNSWLNLVQKQGRDHNYSTNREVILRISPLTPKTERTTTTRRSSIPRRQRRKRRRLEHYDKRNRSRRGKVVGVSLTRTSTVTSVRL